MFGSLVIGSIGRRGSFQDKGNGAPTPLLPGVALLSQKITVDDELIRSVILAFIA
jgi:hypothetical protein